MEPGINTDSVVLPAHVFWNASLVRLTIKHHWEIQTWLHITNLIFWKRQNLKQNLANQNLQRWARYLLKRVRNLESQFSAGNCSPTPQVPLLKEVETKLQCGFSNMQSQASPMRPLDMGHKVLTSMAPYTGWSPHIHWIRKEGMSIVSILSKNKQVPETVCFFAQPKEG